MSSKTRTTAPAAPVRTKDEMEAAVKEITRLKVCEQKQTAIFNESIKAERDEFDLVMKEIGEDLSENMTVAQQWADQNKEAFGKAKSIETLYGVLGWRTGQPCLKTLKGITWKAVLDVVRKTKSLSGFLRIKVELDKDGILRDRAFIKAKTMEKMGVQVVQEETFFVDAKMETAETKLQEAA